MDLALSVENGWLAVPFGDRPATAEGLRFKVEDEPDLCLREIQARLQAL